MASEISVERQFRFHCSCGATIETGERTARCPACGITLGVRRVRRHRQQQRDSVTYYGNFYPLCRAENKDENRESTAATPISPSWTIPVRRVEKRRQGRNAEGVIRRPWITSRLRARLRSALTNCGLRKIDNGTRLVDERSRVLHTNFQ